MSNRLVRNFTKPSAPSGKATRLQVPTLVTLKAAAVILSVSDVTMRRRVRNGSISAVRVEGRIYFEREALQLFVAEHSEPQWRPPGDDRS